MTPRLLDINVLIALAWPSHVHHRQVQTWFAAKRSHGFRTCPLTQLGFVRISSNPGFIKQAVTLRSALTLLDQITSLPEHEFWPDDLSLKEAMPLQQTLFGHRQITDSYLVALAESHGGLISTLDRGMLSVAVGRESLVEIL